MIEKRAQTCTGPCWLYLFELRSLRKLWATLPREVNLWWRQRSRMKLVEENGRWRIEGEGKEWARIAYIKRFGATDLQYRTWVSNANVAREFELLQLAARMRCCSNGIVWRPNNLRHRMRVGEVLKQLQNHPSDDRFFSGYDISPQAVQLAQRRANDRLHFVLGDFSQRRGGFFDLILVLDVIEHLEDYFSFLRGIKTKGIHKMFHIPLDVSVQTVLRGHALVRRHDMCTVMFATSPKKRRFLL